VLEKSGAKGAAPGGEAVGGVGESPKKGGRIRQNTKKADKGKKRLARPPQKKKKISERARTRGPRGRQRHCVGSQKKSL